MLKRLGQHLLNWTLLGVFSALLIVPLWIGGYLVFQPEIQGRVAGAQISLNIELYPNLADFNGYVSFSPRKLRPGLFSDQLQLTAFGGQLATYHNLYQIYNPGKKPLYLKVILAGAPQGFTTDQRVILVLKQPDTPLSTQLKAPVPVGTTLITLENPSTLSPLAKKVIVEDRLLDILSTSDNQIVITPLKQPLDTQQTLYPEAILIDKSEVVWPQTQWIVLGAKQKAVLTAVVFGQTRQGPSADLQTFTLPLHFKASFSPASSE